MFNKNQTKTPRKARKQSGNVSPVFSYYNNRPADLSPKTERGRRKFTISWMHHIRHAPTYLAMFLAVVSVLYALSLSNNPKILIGSTASGENLLRDDKVYHDSVSQILKKSVFNNTKLTIDTNSVANQIQAKFPEIQQATVTLPIVGRRPIIGIDPAEPTLVILTKNSGSFIVGADGRALINTSQVHAKHLNLPTVQDDSGISVEQGKEALPKEYVVFMTTIISQLHVKRLVIFKMQLPTTPNELTIQISGQKYFTKYNLAGDARLQVGTYLAVKDKLASQNITPSEYIDVRVPERAYYK